MVDHSDLELIVKSTEHLRYQSFYWKLYSVIILFLSTFLLYYWWIVPGVEISKSFIILIQAVPLLINILSWVAWFSRQYRSNIFRGDDRMSSYMKSPPNMETCEKRYYITFRALEYEKRTSTIVSILAGFQVFTIGAVSMLMSMGIR